MPSMRLRRCIATCRPTLGANRMLVVAGLTIKNLEPRVWDPKSPYYLPELTAVMVSYAEFHRKPGARRTAMEQGLRRYLDAPDDVDIYLDNGAFSFHTHHEDVSAENYAEFVAAAKPDWYPIPRDYIPAPQMSPEERHACFESTMAGNRLYAASGASPVVHVGDLLEEYTKALLADPVLRSAPSVALGGIVPNLLRAPKARPYDEILANIRHTRQAFADTSLHVFGMGGTSTLHVASLLGVDSVDSSGWRNRAARGLIQLPGTGDRIAAQLGSWRGRNVSPDEWKRLSSCKCPACRRHGHRGLESSGLQGAVHRATHNLWVLLDEAAAIEKHRADGTYSAWYQQHLDNTIYRPLIDTLIDAETPQADFLPAEESRAS